MRNLGIEIIREVPWSTHFCQFYQNKDDLLEILIPYFKSGLENNEYCLWITSEPLNREEAFEVMLNNIAGFRDYINKGQMEIIPYSQWYLNNGSFDSQKVLNGWVEKLQHALEMGFDGLRISGNTLWLKDRDWKIFTEYESAINNIINQYQMIALCTYNLSQCSKSGIIDVLRNHEFTLTKSEGSWRLIENLVNKKTRDELRISEDKFRSIYENSPIGIEIFDAEGILVTANQACLDILGVTNLKQINKINLFNDPNISEDIKERLKKSEAIGYETQYDFQKIKECRFHPTLKSGKYFLDIQLIPLKSNHGDKLSGYLMQIQDVTERKKAEDALGSAKNELEKRVRERTQELEELNNTLNREIEQHRQARERVDEIASSFRNLIASNVDGMLIIDSGRIIRFANPAAAKLLDCDKAELPGMVFGFPLTINEENNIDIHHINGEVINVDMRLAETEWEGSKCYLATLRDVTVKKQTAEGWRQSKAQLENLFNAMTEGVTLIDKNGLVIKANRAMERITGLKLEQIEGHHYAELSKKVINFEHSVLSLKDYPVSIVIREKQAVYDFGLGLERPDGSLIWMIVNAVPLLDSSGNLEGVVRTFSDITDKKNAEEALRALSRKLVDIQENERRNIARELHDEIGQSLTALKLMMSQAARLTSKDCYPNLIEAQSVVTELIRQVREMSLDLRPSMLDDLGLLPTLLWYIERYNNQTKVKVDFEQNGLQRNYSSQLSTAVYRIIQEALTNVARHANTKEVKVRIWADDNNIALRIEDHGRGFTPSALSSSTSTGISGMRERVLLLGGRLNIETSPGSGTCLIAELPVKQN